MIISHGSRCEYGHRDLRRGIIYKRAHKRGQILIVRDRRTVNSIDSIVLVL